MEAVCQGCSKVFEVQKSSRGKYCSNECQMKKQKADRVRAWLETGLLVQKGKWLLAPSGKWIRDYLLERQGGGCAECHTKDWRGKPLVLSFDHKNGNPEDNHPDNVQLICPNCDSQSEHFKGKNRGRGRKSLGYSY